MIYHGSCRDILAYNNLLYYVSTYGELYIFSLANPTKPSFITEFKDGDIYGVSSKGDIAYIIDHENGEFSFLAHLKKSTIVVTAGDRIEIGQYLGLCGNSGHSSEPHLHYHLQNTPVFFQGEGLPSQFQSYVADGKEIERGEPIYGQYVQNISSQ